MTQTPPFGAPAPVGTRVTAFSVDAALVIIVGVGGALLVSPALGAALAADALLGLWILQARRGATPGSLLFRLRTTRVDVPSSPGAGRAFVRGTLVLLGGLVLLAGAWIVVVSAAGDRTGRRRSWADRAAGTMLLTVPPRIQAPDATAPGALASPTIHARTSAARVPMRVDAAAAALPLAPAWESTLSPLETSTATAEAPESAGERVVVAPPAPPTGPVALPDSSGVGFAARSQLLVVFDTGQREQFDLPAAVNFGRGPVATDPGDVLIAVDDPDRLISKTHLRLEHDGEGAWVIDAGSTNGSELVDDDGSARALQPGVRTPLEDGTRVRLGERVFTISRLIGGPV